MLTVLVNAYAISPSKGSEPGMGWNWVTNLAQYCKLHVITEGEWKNEIEDACRNLPQSRNISFYFIPVSEKVRLMANNQGDWRFYWYYRQWQKKAYDKAKEIMEREHIDVIHQLNMIGFREPGFLWKITNKPFVWGPVGGVGCIPMSYLADARWSYKLFFMLKNTLNVLQLLFHPRVRQVIRRADIHISAIPETREGLRRYYGLESVYLGETGCYPNFCENSKQTRDGFNIVWVGKFDFRKQLQLALRTMSLLKQHPDIKLHICGGGDASQEKFFKDMANELGLQESVIWRGNVPHDQVLQEMRTFDMLLFTSLSEGTPAVLMEGIQSHLPIVCFDTCGMGAIVDESVGTKLKMTTPKQSVKEFAEVILNYYKHPVILKQKSDACHDKVLELSWESKAKKMLELYDVAIKNFKQKHPAKS